MRSCRNTKIGKKSRGAELLLIVVFLFIQPVRVDGVDGSGQGGHNKSFSPLQSKGGHNKSFSPLQSKGGHNKSLPPLQLKDGHNKSLPPLQLKGGHNKSLPPLLLKGGSKGGLVWRGLLVIILLTALNACLPRLSPVQLNGKKPLELPVWFWDMPSHPEAGFAVGYSPPYCDSERAFEEAFQDGAWRLFTDRRTVLQGRTGTTLTPYGVMLADTDIKPLDDTTGFSAFGAGLVHLDSVYVPDIMRLVLIGTREVEFDKQRIPAPEYSSGIKEAVAALGCAPKYYRDCSSWIKAENSARLSLAMGYTQVKVLTERSSGTFTDDFSEIVVVEVSSLLTDVQTVHRRLEPSTGARVVWVKGKVEPVPDR